MVSQQRTVLHLVHRLTFGGAERVLVNYLNGSQKHRHVVCSFFPADSFADEILNKDVHVINLGKKDGNDISIPFKLSKICKKFSVEVIHSQGWGTYLEGLICAKFLRRHIKFVFAFHGKTISDLGSLPHRRILAQKLGAVLGDAIITPSEDMRFDYSTTFGVNDRKISVIYNGVDTDLFIPRSRDDSIKNEFGFTDNDVILGCVARFDPVKNFPGLIQAFDAGRKMGMSAKLLLVGDGVLDIELRSLVAKLGLDKDVIFAGRRSDVPQCLHAMDFYVQASFYEGFSMTILEAMSSGLPVIAYDVGGTHEMLQDGVNGILLGRDNDQLKSMAEAMLKIAQNDQQRREMGRKARETVEEFFSLKEMIRQYDQLFLTL